jgi:hypothetical protein
MAWEVEYTDEFEQWWNALSEAEQISLDASVSLLLYGEHLERLRKEGLLNG